MKLYSTSRIQRRLGERLFLKAERDGSAKSAMARRPYPPGLHGTRRRRGGVSEFGSSLREKQKIRFLYGISDSQLKRYVTAASSKKTSKARTLIELLERRMDSAIFRLGFCPSRRVARQMVSHGHFLLNNRRVRTPSHSVRPGDQVTIREASRAHPVFAGLAARLKKHQLPEWLEVSPEEGIGRVKRLAAAIEIPATIDISRVIEFYSR